ncbi:MAG TPA: TonB-dependent receptor plug domain-containing protein, partial [Magnetospirillaceae bacterium]|nr:TonB-dependent receptor plug domain-containing protein [Magnetospirillaceae bacterium]
RTMIGIRAGRARGSLLRGTVSVLALTAMSFAVAPGARATEAAETAAADSSSAEEVVVVGVRRSLENALGTKRDAGTVVDSLSATDIGAFPDDSVSGALQRVPGITVNRLQSNDDSTHPSGEPTGVLIRGLTQVRTEFNGRDSFSADASRGLNFNGVSPELMAGVDAYKNQTADMIEGGVAGTINLRTRLPFDQEGLLISGNLKADYGDRSAEWTGEFSGIVSDTFQLHYGRIGVMANYAHSHVVTQTESVIMDKIDTYCSAGAKDSSGKAIIGADGNVPCTANPFGGKGWAYMPDGVRFSKVDYDRTRDGASAAAQYENDSGSLLATFQFNQSNYHNAWN